MPSLRLNRYSHVLVATEDSAGYRLAAATGAPVRIGFLNAWGKPFKTLWARRILTDGIYRSAGLDRRAPHECEVLFRLGEPLVNGERPTRDLDELRPLLIDDGSAPDDRVAIQITDKWERLGISFEEVVEMVRRIAAGGTPRLLSARSEATYARADLAGDWIDGRSFRRHRRVEELRSLRRPRSSLPILPHCTSPG